MKARPPPARACDWITNKLDSNVQENRLMNRIRDETKTF